MCCAHLHVRTSVWAAPRRSPGWAALPLISRVLRLVTLPLPSLSARQSTATPGAEWEDNFSKLIRSFNLLYWEEDNSVEVCSVPLSPRARGRPVRRDAPVCSVPTAACVQSSCVSLRLTAPPLIACTGVSARAVVRAQREADFPEAL